MDGSLLAAAVNEGWVARVGAFGSLFVIALTVLSGLLKLRIDWRDWTIWDFDPPPRRSGLAVVSLICGLISVVTFSGLLLASSGAVVIGEEALTEIRERHNVQGALAAAVGSLGGAMGFGMAFTTLAYNLLPHLFDLRDLPGPIHNRPAAVALILSVGIVVIPGILVAAILWRKGVSRARLISIELSPTLVLGRFVAGLLLGQIPALVAIVISAYYKVSVNPIPFVGGQ